MFHFARCLGPHLANWAPPSAGSRAEMAPEAALIPAQTRAVRRCFAVFHVELFQGREAPSNSASPHRRTWSLKFNTESLRRLRGRTQTASREESRCSKRRTARPTASTRSLLSAPLLADFQPISAGLKNDSHGLRPLREAEPIRPIAGRLSLRGRVSVRTPSWRRVYSGPRSKTTQQDGS